jgi:hypothetical protein
LIKEYSFSAELKRHDNPANTAVTAIRKSIAFTVCCSYIPPLEICQIRPTKLIVKILVANTSNLVVHVLPKNKPYACNQIDKSAEKICDHNKQNIIALLFTDAEQIKNYRTTHEHGNQRKERKYNS